MKHILLVALLCCAIVLAACGTAAEEEPDLVATQVAVERAAAATLTAEATAAQPTAALPTATPEVVATNTSPAPTSTPTAVPVQPTPTPTQITAVVFPVDGSDGNLDLHGSFVQSNGGRNVLLPGIDQAAVTNPMIFRDRLPVRVEVFDETVGRQDGDGIAAVDFGITGPTGAEVLRVVETDAPYCLWGGNDPACPAPSFAELNYTWPQTGIPIESDFHQAAIIITGTNGTSITWFWGFQIDYRQTNAPVEVILRPACGTRVTAPAATPIQLIYGIWAARGEDRAESNAPYTEISLVIDGQTISGEPVAFPVADVPQAICGRDYEDSYWVYHSVQLPPLSAGIHYVQVNYRFAQAVEDGYGGTYTQPFSQQYQIVVE